jgi:uncharacterized membrane protein
MASVTKTSARSVTRVLGRLALAALLLGAGFGHLTSLREEFQAQVPPWVPVDPDLVVVASGVVELVLGAAVALVPRRFRPLVGWVAAAFFVAVFPGNISQYLTHTDAFGLDSDRSRALRLVFQPVLVVWTLWSTGAWRAWRRSGATAQRRSSVT